MSTPLAANLNKIFNLEIKHFFISSSDLVYELEIGAKQFDAALSTVGFT